MNLITERKWTTLLFNPFVYIAGGQALGLGFAAIIAAGALAGIGQIHFDGVLDMHMGRSAPFVLLIAEGLIDWLSLALVLLVLGKIISRTSFRIVDIFGTQALARWPMIFLVLLALPPAFSNYTHALVAQVQRNPLQPPPLTPAAVYFFGASLLILPLIVWVITLMYNAYSVSCNVKGAKAVLTFIAGLIMAEIIAKVLIALLTGIFAV